MTELDDTGALKLLWKFKSKLIFFMNAESVPAYVIGDSARVMQIFTNLIGNSIKFTSKGRIVVRGRVSNSESSSGSGKGHRRSFSPFSLERCTEEATVPDTVVLVFEIDDTGPGIEPGFLLPEITAIYLNTLWSFWLFHGINSVDIEFDLII